MVLLVSLLVLSLFSFSNSQGPPSPGDYPSSRVGSLHFSQSFRNLWGPQHQSLNQDTLTIWHDHNSGSGIKSLRDYRSDYFGSSVKL
uniref:Xyloglucan endotransglucosylase-hydrolase XTH6 n=1 Tax=Solanum tuberosum TaxID=4113 RepID=M0ZV59_SOLTU